MSEPDYRLAVAAGAERVLTRLPEAVATAVVEFMTGVLIQAPQRVAHPLRRELTGLWAARRGSYRIVYEIDQHNRVVNVVRIDHRADVYHSR